MILALLDLYETEKNEQLRATLLTTMATLANKLAQLGTEEASEVINGAI